MRTWTIRGLKGSSVRLCPREANLRSWWVLSPGSISPAGQRSAWSLLVSFGWLSDCHLAVPAALHASLTSLWASGWHKPGTPPGQGCRSVGSMTGRQVFKVPSNSHGQQHNPPVAPLQWPRPWLFILFHRISRAAIRTRPGLPISFAVLVINSQPHVAVCGGPLYFSKHLLSKLT